jgi:phosphohistidine phosphatase
MKNLLVMRHANAADKSLGQGDIDREISLLGQRQAGEAGLWLEANSLPPQLILCSTSVRTRMTLECLQEGLSSKPEVQFESDIYIGSEADLLTLLHGVPEEVDTLLLIGHNPTISFLTASLAHEEIDFNPATIARLQFNGFEWGNLRAGTCKILEVYRP